MELQQSGHPAAGFGAGAGIGGGAGVGEEQKDAVVEVGSNAELEGLIEGSLGLVVDFWSPTCPPCRMFKPNYHQVANANKCAQLKFCAVNTMVNREAAMIQHISAVPTVQFYYRVPSNIESVGKDVRKLSGGRCREPSERVCESVEADRRHPSAHAGQV